MAKKDQAQDSNEAAGEEGKTYVDRMQIELKQLRNRIRKLAIFTSVDTEDFDALEAGERELLLQQLLHMRAYADVLRARLGNAGVQATTA